MNMYHPLKGETVSKSSRNTPISNPEQNNRAGEWIKSSTIFAIIRSLFGALQLEVLGSREAASSLGHLQWPCGRCMVSVLCEPRVPDPQARCFLLHIPGCAVPQVELRCGLIFRAMARWGNEALETFYMCSTWAALHTS